MTLLRLFMIISLMKYACVGAMFKSYGDMRYCVDVGPSEDFDIDGDVLGMWYAHEVILHNSYETKTEYKDVCPIVYINNIENPSTTTPRQRLGTIQYGYSYPSNYEVDPRFRHLKLTWEEPGYNREYHVKFNYTRPGFWLSAAPNNEYLASEYNHFAGTVQVLKAVRDHIVLSFCQRLPHSSLFSVVLSRSPHRLREAELFSIHRILDIKNLSTASIRKVCNSSSALHISLVLMIAVQMLSLIVKLN